MSEDIQFKLLQAMDEKLDAVRGDISKFGERIATIEEKTTSIHEIEARLDDHEKKIAATDGKIGPLWATAVGIGTMIFGLAGSFMAYLAGFFKGDV